jgi:starch synthase
MGFNWGDTLNKLKIAFFVSELAPLCKTGGLADVAGALPEALAAEGNSVTVFLPFYSEVARSLEKLRLKAEPIIEAFPLWIGSQRITAGVHRVLMNGFEVMLIKCPELYDRRGLYQENGVDFPDNLIRFSALVQASLEVILLLGLEFNVLHSHDWQAALVPVIAKMRYGDFSIGKFPHVLTIHNLGYQGLFLPSEFQYLNLPRTAYSIDGLEYYGRINLLKGGIAYADAITTVSPTYAKEILTEEFGAGLEGMLRASQAKLFGIINGIDEREWNPNTDEHIPMQYNVDSLSGKKDCKEALLDEVGLPADLTKPLLGMITRLATQKGLDLVVKAAESLFKKDLAIIILGTGEPAIHDALLKLSEAYPEKLKVILKFDNGLAHRIEAGADMFLMPSRYEPCGLNQLYSMRYGTIPIVNPVGGLSDTVIPYTEENAHNGIARGFAMEYYTADGLLATIDHALEVYDDANEWDRLLRHVMSLDFSWRASACEYEALYRKLISAQGAM